MTEQLDVAIVGAGPFGLSIAACLGGRKARLFGEPMKTWTTTMPKDMLLRSAWSETSLAAPGRAGEITDWADREGIPMLGPIPLQTFLAYADWFRDRFVGDHDPSDIVAAESTPEGMLLQTAAGNELISRRLVLAVGVTPFPFAPPQIGRVDDPRIQFAIGIRHFEQFREKRVIVIGGGQAGLESAGLAARAGGYVELVSRSPIRWFADREPDRPRSPLRQRLYRLAYPAVGYGPPPLNRLVLHPDLYAALPVRVKRRLTARLLRPGGSPWIRQLIDGHVQVTESRFVTDVTPESAELRIRLDDGSERGADQLIVATGYRFDLDRLAFLGSRLKAQIQVRDGWPVLDKYFRSTDQAVLFVGYPAEGRFGPISRFVLGAAFTAQRVEAALQGG